MDNSVSIADKIRQLEQRLLDPQSRASPAVLSKLLADEFVEFGSSGRVYDKQRIIDYLPRESGVEFSMSDFHIRVLAPGVVLATYRVVRISAEARQTNKSLRSSIWKKENDAWRMVFHQGTVTE